MEKMTRPSFSFLKINIAIILLFIFAFNVSADPNVAWSETAQGWEDLAKKYQDEGNISAAREAWTEAAIAWEREGKSKRIEAVGDLQRVNEIETAIDGVTQELSAWRRNAVSWREAALALRREGKDSVAEQAFSRSSAALQRIIELETQLDQLTLRLNEKRKTLIDMPISDELKSDLVSRWAEVAQSWELTARTWERTGEPGKARIARMKADEVRSRIREIRPDLNEMWFKAKTYPPDEDAVQLKPTVSADTMPLALNTPEQPVVVNPIPGYVPPDIPPRPVLPPNWLLNSDELEDLKSAGVWRQTAEVWRKTSFSSSASGKINEARRAGENSISAADKALQLESKVRSSYAKRELEIRNTLAKAFGEEPRTETDILNALDAGPILSPELPQLSGDAVALAPPPIPGKDTSNQVRRGFFDLEIGGPLPSTLTIRGRKVVDVNYSVTHYTNTDATRDAGNTQSSFNLNQELQVEVLGRVGREDQDHINVNIRYDDTQRGVNSVNNRSIGVDFVGVPHKASWGTYQYDFEFGDISVSLPGSEFAFYNKSLFGAKGIFNVTDLNFGWLKADRVSLQLVGSQTKGVSASKEFTLTGERVPPEEFQDKQFAQDRYYLIEPDVTQLPIKDVKVYRDDGNGANDQGTVQFIAAGAGPTAGYSYSGNWNELIAGQDFVLNQTTGELEIMVGVGPNDYIAVQYSGQAVSYGSVIPNRLIRVSTDTPVAREVFRIHELRNRYKLSRQRIKKNDPNLIFEIRDKLGFKQTTVNGVPTTYLKLFGFDRDGDDKVDIELIDYDFGVIKALDTAPFAKTGNADIDNSAIYTSDNLTDIDYKYIIHIEYSSDQPQEIFTLGFDIIKNSDIVTVDGQKMTRDADYFIDYEAGIITFLNKAVLKPDSKIRVDYEYLPFGGQFERTLMGTRLDVEVSPRLRFGTTLLYDMSADAQVVPNIFEDKPDKNAIVELDAQLQAASLILDWLDRGDEHSFVRKLKDNFTFNIGGEWAWTSHTPNTFGAAVVEDFEAIEDIVSAGFGRTSWQPASAPLSDTAGLFTGGAQNSRGIYSISLKDNFGHKTTSALSSEEKQSSLQLDLSFDATETWVAIRQSLSPAAINFENMTSMEFYVSGLPATVKTYVDVGVISEDADGDGILDSEDNGLDGVANTGDVGENNGVLNTNEDNGINFNHPVRGILNFGSNDGTMTTEDMNNNFKLDQAEAFYRLGELNTSADIERKVFTGSDGTLWTLFRVPWRSRNPVGAANTNVIKHVRLVFERTPGQDSSASFFMDQLSFRGNRFTGSSSDSKIVLMPRNNENDANYTIPARTELKDDPDKKKEQSLGIRWSLGVNDSSTVKQSFAKPINLSDYRRLSFFMAGDAKSETFSLILASDDKNYIEISKRVTLGSDIGGLAGAAQTPIWERIDVELDPIRQAVIANVLGAMDTELVLTPSSIYTIHIFGEPWLLRSPSVSQINQIWLRVSSTAADSGEIWLDDIYSAEPIVQTATAQKASFSSGWSDLWSLSGTWRDVPGKYRGVGIINDPQVGANVERSATSKSLTATLNLHRLLPAAWQILLPLTGSWSQTATIVDPDRVENVLASDLGKLASEQQTYGATLQVWKLPSISVNYGLTTAERDYRLEDYSNRNSTFNANTAYSFSFPRKLFGIIPTGKSLYVNSAYSFAQARSKTVNAPSSGLNSIVTSRRDNQNVNASVNSKPIEPLSLSYDYNMGWLEQQTLIASEAWKGITNRSHRANASLNLPTKFGISPGISTSANYSELFNRATFGGRNKDINLGGNFNITVGLNPSAWTRLLSFLSIRYSYNLSSVATYRALNTGTTLSDVLGDYVGERLFPWGSAKRVGFGAEGVTANRSSASTNNSHNFSGGIKTFSWLQTSYSANITRNEVASLSTISITDGIMGALNMRMDYMQAFPNSFIKFRSSYITGAISYGRTENAASRTNTFSPSMNWNAQWTDALNTTFSMAYNQSTSITSNAPSNRSIAKSLTPSMNFTYFFDIAKIPAMVSLPGIGRVSDLNRRVQLSGGINTTFRQNEVGGKKTSEQNNYGLNLSLGYRISSNLDFTASSSGSWLQDKLETKNDFFTVGGGARVEWRF